MPVYAKDYSRYLDPLELLEPFVEEDTTTPEDREAEARYWQGIREIEKAADAAVESAMLDMVELEEPCPRCCTPLEWDGDESVGMRPMQYCPECGWSQGDEV